MSGFSAVAVAFDETTTKRAPEVQITHYYCRRCTGFNTAWCGDDITDTEDLSGLPDLADEQVCVVCDALFLGCTCYDEEGGAS